MTKVKAFQQQLGPNEAHRAIYSDFEGFTGQHPTQLGMLWAQGRRPRNNDNLAVAFDFLDRRLEPLVDATRSACPTSRGTCSGAAASITPGMNSSFSPRSRTD